MRPCSSVVFAACVAATVMTRGAAAQSGLSAAERQMREHIAQHAEEDVALLARAVNINSGTLNFAGVRAVGDLFRSALDSLGFQTRWVALPDAVKRAGHLIAEHAGKPGGSRILLIGHLDTVFEGEGQQWVRTDSSAQGAGSSDMKGGDVIMIAALKALRAVDALRDANITVILHGDEESPGLPLSESRRDVTELARRSDIGLAFEGGSRSDASVSRRGSSTWLLTVSGRGAHSAGVFGNNYGAIYEAARILDGFRREIAGEKYLTFNAGVIVGGTDVTWDTTRLAGTAAGKTNIIPQTATVPGDLRFITEAQKDSTRTRMRAIVDQHLPGTSAEIKFEDAYPAMPPTAGGARLVALFDSVSQALGYGPVRAQDPGSRGAGDVSFVAPYIDGMDGLGALGAGAHTPRERVNLNSLVMQAERSAALIYRLLQAPPIHR